MTTNKNNLHPGIFTFTYKSWGKLQVRHILNFDDGSVRLEVTQGEDKGASFVVSHSAMLAAIDQEIKP